MALLPAQGFVPQPPTRTSETSAAVIPAIVVVLRFAIIAPSVNQMPNNTYGITRSGMSSGRGQSQAFGVCGVAGLTVRRLG
ncbi:hypothetical protein GCM10008901_13920 [Bifidobacterium pullorum]